MKLKTKFLILFLIIACLFGIYIFKVNNRRIKADKLKTISYHEVKEMAEPAVLYFTSESCFACKIIEPTLVEIQHEFEGKVNIATISLDNEENYFIANLYNVMVTPTLVYLDRDKNYVNESKGAISHGEIVNYLKGIGVK